MWYLKIGASIPDCIRAAVKEAGFLKLDCSKIKSVFEWKPHWSIDKTLEKTIEVYLSCYNNNDIEMCVKGQIEDYLDF